jgi:phospholipid/cholesterol/gamma-HCH transport system substrate-binding protein
MDENILKLRVGIFVLISMVILGILIMLNGEGWNSQYVIYIKPFSAPSVSVGTPIRKNGILIGRVKSVIGEDDYVTVGMGINADAKIYQNETAKIGAESILGDAVIEILPLPRVDRGNALSNEDLLTSVALQRNPMELVDIALKLETEISDTLVAIREAGVSVNQAGEGIDKLTNKLQSVIDDEDSELAMMISEFRKTALKAQTALDGFNRIFENLNDIVGDRQLKEEFRRAISSLPSIFDEVKGTITDTRRTIKTFEQVATKTNTNLDNIETFTNSLKKEGPEILVQINESLKNVEGLVTQIKAFGNTLQKLQTSEGTIGKLINDTEIYDSIKYTVENVRDVSDRLEPLMNDMRNFADSIARDPGVIGVRGAIDRRPEKTGYKGTAGRDGGLE